MLDYIICELCECFTAVLYQDYRGHLIAVHKKKIKKTFEVSTYQIIRCESVAELVSKEHTKWLKKKEVHDNSKRRSITWKHIIFEDRKIRFTSDVGSNLKPFDFEPSIRSLNLIKEEYFERLFPKKRFKLYFYQNRLHSLSPDYTELLNIVEKAILYEEFVEPVIVEVPIPSEREPKVKSLYDFDPPNHTKYMKFLASLQSSHKTIISIRETTNGLEEDCFLYRIFTYSKCIFIVWESIEPNRATHIFKTNSQNEELILKKVKTHILRKDIKNKRQILNLKVPEAIRYQKSLSYLTMVKHNNTINFESYFNYLRRKN